MRPFLPVPLLLLAAFALGGERTSDRDRVEELVARLASPVHLERLDARVRLMALGESIHPLLERLARETVEPKIARAISEITRSARTLRLEIRKTPGRLVLGSDLVVEIALHNRSDLTYVIAFHSPQAPELASFHLRTVRDWAKGDRAVPIQIDGNSPGSITLGPGDSLPLSLRLGGIENPALGSGPSLLRLVLRVDSLWARDLPTPKEGSANEHKDWTAAELGLESKPFSVTWIARPVQELERLLASGTEEERDSAARELHVRDGKEILRLLRRRANDPLLRLAAIRRLGAAGEERDFDLLRKAAKNATDTRIKLAAVEALGNFRSDSARRQLMLHVDDVAVRTAAIRALSKHKHHATVECYIRLLKNNVSGGPWVAVVQDTLEAWTGLRVPSRYSEVVSFEKWWGENRARWIQEQVIGK